MFLEQYWGGPRTYSDQRGHPRLRMRHARSRSASSSATPGCAACTPRSRRSTRRPSTTSTASSCWPTSRWPRTRWSTRRSEGRRRRGVAVAGVGSSQRPAVVVARASSIRCIRAPSATATATASATSTASPPQLDYLEALGVDAIWLNPVMVSPMADHGYDVADPRDVDPLFGGIDGAGPADRGRARARHQGDDGPGAQPHQLGAPVVSGGAGREPRQRRSVSATSSATAPAPAASIRRTTGCRSSAAPRGPASSSPTATPASGICTCSTPSSPT